MEGNHSAFPKIHLKNIRELWQEHSLQSISCRQRVRQVWRPGLRAKGWKGGNDLPGIDRANNYMKQVYLCACLKARAI